MLVKGDPGANKLDSKQYWVSGVKAIHQFIDLIKHEITFIPENAFATVVCKMLAILFRRQYIKSYPWIPITSRHDG